VIIPGVTTPRPSRGLVIFDLDGTLVDSRVDLANAVNRVLADLGRPPRPVDEIVGFVGHGVARLLECALGGPELVAAARPLFERHYAAGLLEHTRAYPGIDALVRESGARRVLAVATNKPGPWARAIVDGLGWAAAIPHVIGGGDVAQLKPAPDMVELLLARSGFSREGALIVGDMEVDLELARETALPAVGVSWGLAGRGRLEAAGARWIVDSPAELADLLDELAP
jgi:phosphoglycolate phosphatase